MEWPFYTWTHRQLVAPLPWRVTCATAQVSVATHQSWCQGNFIISSSNTLKKSYMLAFQCKQYVFKNNNSRMIRYFSSSTLTATFPVKPSYTSAFFMHLIQKRTVGDRWYKCFTGWMLFLYPTKTVKTLKETQKHWPRTDKNYPVVLSFLDPVLLEWIPDEHVSLSL